MEHDYRAEFEHMDRGKYINMEEDKVSAQTMQGLQKRQS
jgi:hypothetical protein